MDICSTDTHPLSSLYCTHARTYARARTKRARRRGFGRRTRPEKDFWAGKRAALTGFAGVFVVYGLCPLLLVIVVVRLFVVEAVTNCHFAPKGQAGKDQRDPAHLSGQCRGHSVHLKTEFEKGARAALPMGDGQSSLRGTTASAARILRIMVARRSPLWLSELLCLAHGRSAPGRVGAVRLGVSLRGVRRGAVLCAAAQVRLLWDKWERRMEGVSAGRSRSAKTHGGVSPAAHTTNTVPHISSGVLLSHALSLTV